MPMPPLLPSLDWQAIHASGVDYEEWLARGEHPENRREMEEGLRVQTLGPAIEGYLAALPTRVHVVGIAEDWCGDVIRHVPVLQRMAQAAPNLWVSYVTRSQHLEVFARFLTNGGEAIPKFIFFSERFVECGHWGPLPEACRRLIARGKACGDVSSARKKVSLLYQADPEKRQVVRELLDLIDTASAQVP